MNIYRYYNTPGELSGYSKRNIIVPELAYENARQQEKRVPEAEPIIKQNPCYAYFYALNVIKDRWPEAEPYIEQNNLLWKQYQQHFGVRE